MQFATMMSSFFIGMNRGFVSFPDSSFADVREIFWSLDNAQVSGGVGDLMVMQNDMPSELRSPMMCRFPLTRSIRCYRSTQLPLKEHEFNTTPLRTGEVSPGVHTKDESFLQNGFGEIREGYCLRFPESCGFHIESFPPRGISDPEMVADQVLPQHKVLFKGSGNGLSDSHLEQSVPAKSVPLLQWHATHGHGILEPRRPMCAYEFSKRALGHDSYLSRFCDFTYVTAVVILVVAAALGMLMANVIELLICNFSSLISKYSEMTSSQRSTYRQRKKHKSIQRKIPGGYPPHEGVRIGHNGERVMFGGQGGDCRDFMLWSTRGSGCSSFQYAAYYTYQMLAKISGVMAYIVDTYYTYRYGTRHSITVMFCGSEFSYTVYSVKVPTVQGLIDAFCKTVPDADVYAMRGVSMLRGDTEISDKDIIHFIQRSRGGTPKPKKKPTTKNSPTPKHTPTFDPPKSVEELTAELTAMQLEKDKAETEKASAEKALADALGGTKVTIDLTNAEYPEKLDDVISALGDSDGELFEMQFMLYENLKDSADELTTAQITNFISGLVQKAEAKVGLLRTHLMRLARHGKVHLKPRLKPESRAQGECPKSKSSMNSSEYSAYRSELQLFMNVNANVPWRTRSLLVLNSFDESTKRHMLLCSSKEFEGKQEMDLQHLLKNLDAHFNRSEPVERSLIIAEFNKFRQGSMSLFQGLQAYRNLLVRIKTINFQPSSDYANTMLNLFSGLTMSEKGKLLQDLHYFNSAGTELPGIYEQINFVLSQLDITAHAIELAKAGREDLKFPGKHRPGPARVAATDFPSAPDPSPKKPWKPKGKGKGKGKGTGKGKGQGKGGQFGKGRAIAKIRKAAPTATPTTFPRSRPPEKWLSGRDLQCKSCKGFNFKFMQDQKTVRKFCFFCKKPLPTNVATAAAAVLEAAAAAAACFHDTDEQPVVAAADVPPNDPKVEKP